MNKLDVVGEPIAKPKLIPTIDDAENSQIEFLDNDWQQDDRDKIKWKMIKLPKPEDAVVPAWMHTLEIEWMEKYSNSPTFNALYHPGEDPHRKLDGPIWKRIDRRMWVAQRGHLLTIHYHGGTLTWAPDADHWETTKSQGYGGRGFEIEMDPAYEPFNEPGRNKVVLRGPWHGTPPRGFTSVSVREAGSDRCYVFGLEVMNIAIVRAFPHFFPDHKLAVVDQFDGKMISIQPIHPSWDAPKDVMMESRRIKYGYMDTNSQPE